MNQAITNLNAHKLCFSLAITVWDKFICSFPVNLNVLPSLFTFNYFICVHQFASLVCNSVWLKDDLKSSNKNNELQTRWNGFMNRAITKLNAHKLYFILAITVWDKFICSFPNFLIYSFSNSLICSKLRKQMFHQFIHFP